MNNYEQKYKEALKRAKMHYNTTDSVADAELLELVFPELKESEDERTRKELISFLEICQDTRLVGNRKREKWIAWLEKKTGEWNGNDETPMKKILAALDFQKFRDGATGQIVEPYKEETEWLKSIKKRLGGE